MIFIPGQQTIREATVRGLVTLTLSELGLRIQEETNNPTTHPLFEITITYLALHQPGSISARTILIEDDNWYGQRSYHTTITKMADNGNRYAQQLATIQDDWPTQWHIQYHDDIRELTIPDLLIIKKAIREYARTTLEKASAL